jgi:hypothetical protein
MSCLNNLLETKRTVDATLLLAEWGWGMIQVTTTTKTTILMVSTFDKVLHVKGGISQPVAVARASSSPCGGIYYGSYCWCGGTVVGVVVFVEYSNKYNSRQQGHRVCFTNQSFIHST